LKPQWKSKPLPLDHPQAVAAFVRADGTADSLQALRAILKEPRADLLAILAEVGTADDLASILHLESSKLDPAVLRAMRVRKAQAPADAAHLLEPHFKSNLQSEAALLAGQWKVEALLPMVREMANKEGNPAAIEALGKYGSEQLPLLRQIATSGSANAKAAALAQWQIFEPREAAIKAAEFIEAEANENQCTNVLIAFVQRPASAAELAKAIGNKVLPAHIQRVALATITGSGRRDEQLLRAISTKSESKKIVDDQFVAEVRDRGDAARGKQIFNRAELGCSVCHKVNGSGGTIGPDLSALGTAQPIDFIARAILEPQKEIKEGFSSVSIAMKNGDEFQGYVVRENPEEIVLKDPLVNQEVRLRRAEVASGRANGSLMPNGLADQLEAEEFRDLVKFLSSLGKP
jgi:putative heme-binding domain-containing protein